MDFGRITDSAQLDRIQWRLPALDSAEELAQLERVKRAASKSEQMPQIYIGLPVWSEAKWVGQLYPQKTKSENFLKEYSKQFSTVEINSTFYAVPGEPTFQKWANAVGPDFRFCPKFPQTISRSLAHQANLSDLEKFIAGVRILEPCLGLCFLQLPPDFHLNSIDRLAHLFTLLPPFLKTMVEFRHASFYEGDRLNSEVVELLARNRIGTVITDTALYRNFVHASLSSTRVLIRFAASNGHPSDQVRVDQWVERVVLWFQAGMKEIFITVHATETGPQIEIARTWIRKLNAAFQARKIAYSIPEPRFFHEQQADLF